MTAPGPRVAYVLDRYPVLSQTFVTGEVTELRRQGAAVTVIAQQAGDDVPGEQADLLLTDLSRARWQLYVDHVRCLIRSPRRYRTFRRRVKEVAGETGLGVKAFDWRVLPTVATVLRTSQIEVLHAHFAWAGAAAAYCLAALLDVPWSMTVHANDIFAETRNIDVKLRSCSRLITVCDYNVRFLRESLGVSRPVDVVVCGVQLPETVDLPKRVDVVAVGRLVEKKGFDVLIEAIALMPQGERPTVEVVGDGTERARLVQLVVDHGLEDRVRFLGPLPHEQTLERIGAARILCLPARIAANGDRDSMPVVIKEALARQVPVVASDAVAIPEMVDRTVGRLVPPDAPAALAAALGELLDLPDADRRRLGAAGRQRVSERFTLQGETARLRAILVEEAARMQP